MILDTFRCLGIYLQHQATIRESWQIQSELDQSAEIVNRIEVYSATWQRGPFGVACTGNAKGQMCSVHGFRLEL